jgi:L-ascorbate metabolism protein UlaG (beta-lactamase superfamily)
MTRSVCLKFLVGLLFGAALSGFAAPAVTVFYGENAQVELIASNGVRVLIDVHDPSRLSAPATEADILLTTHTHADHCNQEFVANFEGRQLFTEAGSIVLEGVRIQGIAASHNPGGGTNIMYLVEMDGLRIAHCGDLGQRSFSDEQLTVMGKIDIAVMQLDNSYSQMNAVNKTGFKLMAQLGPGIIIPTHISLQAVKYGMTVWPCLYSAQESLAFSPDDLTGETRLLFLGGPARRYAEITNAREWGE